VCVALSCPGEQLNPSSSKGPRIPHSSYQQSSQKKTNVPTTSQSNTLVQRLCRTIQNQNSSNDTPSRGLVVLRRHNRFCQKRPPITPQAATMIHKPTNGVTKTYEFYHGPIAIQSHSSPLPYYSENGNTK
jgi:hypothetical protein